MTLEKLNRQARFWTIFKLLVLVGIMGTIAFLLWQGVGTTPSLIAPTITTPPLGMVGQVVELSGGGAPNGVVEIAVSGEPIGRTLVSPTGRWEYALPAFTEAGRYDVSATAVDLYTQTAQTTRRQNATLTIEDKNEARKAATTTIARQPSPTPTIEPSPTTAPTATAEPSPTNTPTPTLEPSPTTAPTTTATADPLFLLPDPEVDIQADGRFILRGEGVPSSTIQLLLDGEVVDTIQTDADGRWVYEFLFTEPSDYEIVAQALGEDGEVLATSTQLLTVEDPAADVALESGATISTVLTLIETDNQFSTLLTALETAALTETLSTDEPFILFAPTDTAFEALPAEALTAFLENPDNLADLLRHHLITNIDELTAGQQITTAAGDELLITEQDGTLFIGRAQVLSSTVTAAGTLHTIDQLLIPTAAGITPPLIDDSGVPTYEGPFLTVVGTAEPETRLVLMINGELYGEMAVAEDGSWLVDGIINPPGDFHIIAYTLSDEGLPLAVSSPVVLTVE